MILTKCGPSQQILIKVSIIKFHENPSNGSTVYKCRDRHVDAIRNSSCLIINAETDMSTLLGTLRAYL